MSSVRPEIQLLGGQEMRGLHQLDSAAVAVSTLLADNAPNTKPKTADALVREPPKASTLHIKEK